MSLVPKKFSASCRILAKEYQAIMKESVEGCHVTLVDDKDIFEWELGIFGPPKTIYEGGYFRARMRFPENYPFAPPFVRFIDEMCHPNIYKNGLLCISILHTRTETEYGGESPCERWNLNQNARTIILSTISLLNDPNIFSPANPDAAELYRRWRDSNGKDKAYYTMVRRQAVEGNATALRLGIVVPKTIEEYCRKTTKAKPESVNNGLDKEDDKAENSNLKKK